MKMSDVFALPVKRVGDTLADQGGYADVECAIDAAAHAINQHDALVEALENLLESCSSIRGIDMMMYIPGVITEVERVLEREKLISGRLSRAQ